MFHVTVVTISLPYQCIGGLSVFQYPRYIMTKHDRLTKFIVRWETNTLIVFVRLQLRRLEYYRIRYERVVLRWVLQGREVAVILAELMPSESDWDYRCQEPWWIKLFVSIVMSVGSRYVFKARYISRSKKLSYGFLPTLNSNTPWFWAQGRMWHFACFLPFMISISIHIVKGKITGIVSQQSSKVMRLRIYMACDFCFQFGSNHVFSCLIPDGFHCHVASIATFAHHPLGIITVLWMMGWSILVEMNHDLF